MAESYRGLTIRIGADTTGLTKALRGINSAAATAQKQLRGLAQAARIDPGNANVATQQIGAMARAAMDSAAKLRTLYDAKSKALEELPAGKTSQVDDVANAFSNMALEAENAKDKVNLYTEALAADYTKLTEAYRKIQPDAKAFNVDNSELVDIRAALDELVDAGQMAASEADETYARIDRLKGAFRVASDEYGVAKQLASYEDLNVEIAKTEANLNKYNDQLARMKSSDISQGIQGIKSNFDLLNTAASVANDRFQRLDKAFKLDPSNMDIAVERAKALSEAQDLAQKKGRNLQQQLEAYKAQGIDRIAASMVNVQEATEAATRAAADANTKYEMGAAKVRSIGKAMETLERDNKEGTSQYLKLSVQLNKAEHEMDQLKQAAEEANEVLEDSKKVAEYEELRTQAAENAAAIEKMGKSTKSSFDDISAGAAVVSSAITSTLNQIRDASIEQANAVDSAYRDLRKTLNATEDEYEHLRDAAVEFSQTHVTSAETMLEMEALGAQVGISADGLQRFAETASNLDIATDIDAEDIALQLGQLVNVMDDLTEDNVDLFADALVRLGNNMPAQESAIMNISQRLSSFGDIVGFTTPEVLGWSAAIASTGQKSEAAATAISNTIGKIEQVVAEGGEDLEAYAQVAGMSAEEFADAWNTKPSEALRDFIEGLGNLDESGESAIKILQDLELTGVRRQQALLGLSQTLGNLDEALLMSNHAWNGVEDEWGAAGDAAREAQRKSEGFSGALAIMQNNLQNLAATAGEAFLPFIQAISSGLQILTGALKAIPTEIRSVVVGITGIGSVLLAAAPAIVSYGNAIKSLAEGYRKHRNEAKASADVLRERIAATEALARESDKEAVAQVRAAYQQRMAAKEARKKAAADKMAAEASRESASAARTQTNAFFEQASAESVSANASKDGAVAAVEDATAKKAQAEASVTNATAATASAEAQTADAAATTASTAAHKAASSAIVDHLASLASLVPAATPAVLAVGALAAVIGGLTIARIVETSERLSGMAESVDEFAKATRGSIGPTRGYVNETRSLGEVLDETRSGMESFSEAMSSHAEAISNMREEYDNTGVIIDRLTQVTDEYVGAGNASAEAMGELEWAAQQLSDQLGYNVTAEDLLKGTYEDESGAVHNLKDEIDQLLEARKREAQLNAYSGMYEEAVQAHADATQELAKAQNAYNQTVEYEAGLYAAYNHVSMDEAREWATENADGIGELKAAIDEAAEAERLAAVNEENYAYVMGLTNKASNDATSGLEQFMAAHQDMMGIINDNGYSLQTFQEQLEELGITSDEMSQYSAEDITRLASAYDGSMESITAWIDEYNKQELDDKESNVSAKGNVADGSAEEKIRRLNDTVSRLADRTITVGANGNLVDGSALDVVSRLKTRLDQLQNGKWSISASINLPKRASGGIARHMAGGIATSATLTPHGLVGEAGAEYYDGDNIVPLTRTNVERYASGFTDVIADKVAARVGVGNVSNIQIGDLTVNNDEELEAAIRRVAVLVARRRDM